MTDKELIAHLRSINKNYELARGVHVDIRLAADRIEALTKAVEALRGIVSNQGYMDDPWSHALAVLAEMEEQK